MNAITAIKLMITMCFLCFSIIAHGDTITNRHDAIETCKLYIAAVTQTNLIECLKYVTDDTAIQIKRNLQAQTEAFITIQKFGTISYDKVLDRGPYGTRVLISAGEYKGHIDLLMTNGEWRIWNY